MTRAIKRLGDRMLAAVLPKAEAKAANHICKWINPQCWINCSTGCSGCNYGGPTCGCTEYVVNC